MLFRSQFSRPGVLPPRNHRPKRRSARYRPRPSASRRRFPVRRRADAPDRVARTAYWGDDDGGGNLEPSLNFTTTFAGTLVLHVSKFSAEREAGCYFYKVEIVTP